MAAPDEAQDLDTDPGRERNARDASGFLCHP
jgi:hypothetical protein